MKVIKNQEKKLLILLFSFALILRLLVAYIYSTYGPDYVFYDEQFYRGTAEKFWHYWQNASFLELFDYNTYAFKGFAGRNFGYNIVYALVSHWLGEFGGRIVNSLFLCLAAYFTYLIAIEVSNKKVAILSYCIVLFYPSGILYSITLHKESFVIFSIALFMLSLIKLFKKYSIKWLALSSLGFLCIFTSRVYIPFLILLSVSIVLIWNSKKNLFSWLTAGILIAFMIYYLADVIRENIDLNTLLFWRKEAVSFVGSYWNTYRKLSFLPVSLVALIFYSFQPLPWNITSIWFTPVNLGSLVWYIMFPFFILGLAKGIKTKEYRLIVISILVIAAFYVFIYITGTEYRHREQMIPLLAIVSAIGYYRFKLMSFNNKIIFISIPCALITGLGFYKLWVLLS